MTGKSIDGSSDSRASVVTPGTQTSLTGGLVRRSRALMKRYNSAPENTVLDLPSKIIIGVCAMDKKARSKPMREILQRMTTFNEFTVEIFGDDVILNQPPDQWPKVDCLLSWHSDGFPLHKAQEYVALRHPFCVNDVAWQQVLLDRRQVYATLKANGIPVPNHIIVNREPPPGYADGAPLVDAQGMPLVLPDPPGFIEDHDYVELNGVRIMKPFVEKPASGEDHNVYIYYPHSHGGGVKRLFRKVDDRSSQYDSKHPGNVRRDGSYVYEEFLTTGGTDVKVYTVGPRYAHAEARKSPVVDGRVQRSSDGKEMRYPVLLSPQEKEISRMVCLAFSQKVCGFDLLRSEKGKSYVCDVNGWSFVKNSNRFYDDAAGILRSMVLTALAPQRVMTMPMLLPAPIPAVQEGNEAEGDVVVGACALTASQSAHYGDSSMKAVASLQDMAMGALGEQENANEELRCVLAVIRHGDRTPKQKIKVKISQPALLALFDKYRNSKGEQAKLKNPLQLQEFLNVVRELLASTEHGLTSLSTTRGANSGADGALASAGAACCATPLVPMPEPAPTTQQAPIPELGHLKMTREALEEFKEQMTIVRTVLEQGGGHFSGVNRKVQLKPLRWRTNLMDTANPNQAPSLLRNGEPSAAATTAATQVVVNTAVPTHLSAASSAAGTGPLSTPNGSSGGAKPSGGSVLQLEEALLVVKWGGVLTHAGRQQAEQLGLMFRACMYPRHGPAGGGLLRLHSTYRHDLKIYSSDEGRVQVSAASFTKGLLDLEGNSLTPILVSLVNKDASMLEAFGKGASEEMQSCKAVINAQLTHDPSKGPRPPIGTILPCHIGLLTATPSPPFSPGPSCGPAHATRATSQPRPLPLPTPPAQVPLAPLPPQQQQQQQAAALPGGDGSAAGGPFMSGFMTSLAEWDASNVASPSRGPSPAIMPGTEQLPVLNEAADEAEHKGAVASIMLAPAAPPPVGSFAMAAAGGGVTPDPTATDAAAGQMAVPCVQGGSGQQDRLMHMPDQPLQLLQLLLGLIKQLVARLHSLVQEESAKAAAGTLPPVKPYNSQSQAPEEWELVPAYPCGGEHLVLLYDRWRKLYDALYSEKKGSFDISKIPDIYDSVKHDTIHNAHLGLPLDELYSVAKVLADVVIPHEYGINPHSKLSIGSKIAKELVGKLLADMSSMKMESESTALPEGDGGVVVGSGDELGADTMATEFGRHCLEDDRLRNRFGNLSAVTVTSGNFSDDAEAGGAGELDDEEEDRARHRLCPTYASDINSPLRHVRTRIYFTSESHIHSLVNVLRFCHLRDGAPAVRLVGNTRQATLDRTPELDYLTHIVFRMYENMSVPVGDPARFRVEVLFSPGAARDPRTHTPLDHALPVVQLEQLNDQGTAQTFSDVDQLLAPFSVARKVDASTYALSIALKAPSNPVSRKTSSHIAGSLPGGGPSGAIGYKNLDTLYANTNGGSSGGVGGLPGAKGIRGSTGSLASQLSNTGPTTASQAGGAGASSNRLQQLAAGTHMAAAMMHCSEPPDRHVAGATGSGMAGIGSELVRMGSTPEPHHVMALHKAQQQ